MIRLNFNIKVTRTLSLQYFQDLTWTIFGIYFVKVEAATTLRLNQLYLLRKNNWLSDRHIYPQTVPRRSTRSKWKYCWRVKVYLNKLKSNTKVGKYVEIKQSGFKPIYSKSNGKTLTSFLAILSLPKPYKRKWREKYICWMKTLLLMWTIT